jgi:hypothetical protein
MAVNGNRFSRTTTFFLLAGAAGLLTACGIWYVKAIRTPEIVDLQKIDKNPVPERVKIPPDTVHLDSTHGTNLVRSHLLDGNFKSVYRVQDVSQTCWSSFNSSFVGNPGTISKGLEVPFADPGQPAQYGDSLIPDAPFRQLVFAGQGPKSCFVYFQHGGVDHPSYCLAVLYNASGKPIWVGEARKKVRNLRELRSLLSTHQFDDTSGPKC